MGVSRPSLRTALALRHLEYYVTERIRSDDPKAVGPLLFAALERER